MNNFDSWMAKVDSILSTKIGLDSRDLADCCYRDWHEEGMSAARAAAKAIKANGDF